MAGASTSETGCPRAMAPPLFRGINVVPVPVTDLDRARDFYGGMLGLGAPLYDLPEAGWIEFPVGGTGGNLAVTRAEPGWQPSPGAIVVLDVEDCTAAVAALRRRGVACDDPRTFPGYVTFATVHDPFGNRLQICSPAPDA